MPPQRAPVLVGFSGGLDSTVLLHWLAHHPQIRDHGLRAIHVHHALHTDADTWLAHCEAICSALSVPLQAIRVHVPRDTGQGLEAAARHARHAAFTRHLAEHETLALAHHQDDQAETFLLRALRGSGCDGLAAMQMWREYQPGWLWRPLLDTPRAELLAYAQTHTLTWLDDPSNRDTDFDRNFLRNTVFPLLQQRWPQASACFARSAALSAQATTLLNEEDAHALRKVQYSADTLHVESLRQLSPARRARVLRLWVSLLGLPALPGQGVRHIESDLLPAQHDTEACFIWAQTKIQRWRGYLHAGMQRELPKDWSALWDTAQPLTLPTGDTLTLLGPPFPQVLRVHARQGGERIRLPNRQHSHALKQVLQDNAIPPWHRLRMPLLSSAEGQLLAAGDTLLSAHMKNWLNQHDAHLSWHKLP
jgi:tRNA(Ile)-lysidine synthase